MEAVTLIGKGRMWPALCIKLILKYFFLAYALFLGVGGGVILVLD